MISANLKFLSDFIDIIPIAAGFFGIAGSVWSFFRTRNQFYEEYIRRKRRD